MKKNHDSLDAMFGAKFLKEIDVEDMDRILDALKQYGNDDLIDKWVSVTMIAKIVASRKTEEN